MPTVSFGPRARRVYVALRDRIARGDLAAGEKLPPHIELATAYGVAPLTMRQVLARLEEEGLVVREHGRGTFVHAQVPPAVLIVEDDMDVRARLEEYVVHAGYRSTATATVAEGLTHLTTDRSIALVFTEAGMANRQAGHDFIRALRRRWPTLPVVAVTGSSYELDGLLGTAECPVLILPRPFWPHQVEEILRLSLPRYVGSGTPI
jgi:DNA-binding GntR family transcriptional regulator